MRRTPLVAATLALALLLAASASAADFSARDVYRAASPAVVLIMAGSGSSFLAGSGSFIGSGGLVLTNNHVIEDEGTRQPAKTILVFLKPARITGDPNADLKNPLAAKVVARDRDLDLAVLQVEGAKGSCATVRLGDSGGMTTGDAVAAIGHPEGGGLWTLTTGTISGTKKMGAQDAFQTEANLNRGNSGGPLLDASARLVGVNTSTVRKAPDGLAIVGVNFAVKSAQVESWLSSQGIRYDVAPASDGPVAPPATPAAPAPTPKAETKPEAKAATPAPAATPQTEKKPAKIAEQPIPASDDLQEFRGPGGELMYGRPGGKFSLDKSLRDIFSRARANAEKDFQELDQETGDQ